MISSIDIDEVIAHLGIEKLREDVDLVKTIATPPEDARILFSIVKTLAPSNILEIGTFYGNTTYGLARNSPDSQIHTIDIFMEMEVQVPEYQTREVLSKSEVGNLFKDKGLNITQIYGDSRNKKTYKDLLKMDFAYIDGNHDKESVIKDSLNVLDITHEGSLIFWHDYKDDGLVEIKEALLELSSQIKQKIYHINNSWLAFMIV